MNALLSSFFQEALDEFVLLPLEKILLHQSFDLVLQDDLRTLDSLQLSAGLSLGSELEDLEFISADDDLITADQRRGLDTH